MTQKREFADEPFFREWKNRKQGQRRSLQRARLLASKLKLNKIPFPILTVVGSKGKATTAIYASSTIAATGLRVGTLTSPPIISNRERIRINGRAISAEEFEKVSKNLSDVLDTLSPERADGYLSPSGLFTLMGLRYMIDVGCDAAVLEAGMGGKSDEVSLFPSAVVAISSIFGEHLGILGKNIKEIACDKVGVISEKTRAVLTVRQCSEVQEVIMESARDHDCVFEIVEGNEPLVSGAFIPPGLSAVNATLGMRSAFQFLQFHGKAVHKNSHFISVLSSIRTPGRLSVHKDQDGRTWIVDAAINETGAAAALAWTEQNIGEIDVVLVSIPAGKDVIGVRRALNKRQCVPIQLDTEHLEFDNREWGQELIPFSDMDAYIKGHTILAIGTWSFVGAVLDKLGVDYETAFHEDV